MVDQARGVTVPPQLVIIHESADMPIRSVDLIPVCFAYKMLKHRAEENIKPLPPTDPVPAKETIRTQNVRQQDNLEPGCKAIKHRSYSGSAIRNKAPPPHLGKKVRRLRASECKGSRFLRVTIPHFESSLENTRNVDRFGERPRRRCSIPLAVFPVQRKGGSFVKTAHASASQLTHPQLRPFAEQLSSQLREVQDRSPPTLVHLAPN